MTSDVTEYRADFFKANGELKFSVDTNPEKDPDATVPVLLVHAGLIFDSGLTVMRWVRPELEPYIGDLIVPPVDPDDDVICVYGLSVLGDLLEPPLTNTIDRIEAFAVNSRGGVKQGCMCVVDGATVRTTEVIPGTPNYVLEKLCYTLGAHVQLFDSPVKHIGKRKILAP